jgi:transposase
MWNSLRLREDYTAGKVRAAAARVGGMDRQTLRDWGHRFNSQGPDGLRDRWSSGSKSRLTPSQKEELARLVEAGPDPAVNGVVPWRCLDLKQKFVDVSASTTTSNPWASC